MLCVSSGRKLSSMLRKNTGVVVGYAIFVISALAYFKLSGHDPHVSASGAFRMLTACYGVFFSMLSGYVLQLIARAKNLQPNYVLAIIMAGFATFSMLKSTGSSWTQMQAIVVFAPVSILGGWIFLERNRS